MKRSTMGTVMLLSASVLLGPVAGADQAIEDVRMSRRDGVARAEVALGCRMRYLDHQPRESGVELRISLDLEPGCSRSIQGIRGELHRPRGGGMGAIGDVEFSRSLTGRAVLIFRFQVPVRFEVGQGGDFSQLRVDISRDQGASRPVPRVAQSRPNPTLPVPQAATPRAAATPKVRPQSGSNRAPLKLTENTWLTKNQFVIQLGAYSESSVADVGGYDFGNHTVYESQVIAGDSTWRVMRVGFFATESAADQLLQGLPADKFPKAFIAAASPAEQARAAATTSQPAVTSPPIAAPLPTAATLPAERIAELMLEAKTALREGNLDRSIQIYEQLLLEPETGHRREAREFLGLVRERQGQPGQAKAHYQAYLAEFPQGADSQRVRQRMSGVADTSEAATVNVSPIAEDKRNWEIFAGIAQYYRRDEVQVADDQPSRVQQAAIISNTDLVIRRDGDRFDLVGRFNGAYHRDLLQTTTSSGDQGYISHAYVDIFDRDLQVNARVGRQSQYTGGVLGRFDGARLSYRWRPNLLFNANAGFPTDTPRSALSTRRFFYGGSIDLENVAEVWGFSAFFNIQSVDGISDREAVGAEVRFRNGPLNLVGMTDVDLSYGVLNSALAAGTWQVNDRVSLNGRINFGAVPFLTTRNAVIGQSVTTIESLEAIYSEGQIRRIARNRTAQVANGSMGIIAAMSERLQISADIGYYDTGSTVASAGVARVPANNTQTFVSTSLIGSSVFKTGDTAIFTLRHSVAKTTNTSSAIVDLRYPVGNRLRISPRLAITVADNSLDGTQQLIAQPNIRAIWRWQRRFRLELELGGLWSDRDIPANSAFFGPGMTSDEGSAYYVNAGYWMDF